MAKEIIKNNVVNASTLFVGVGGTGSDIVQRVADMCRPGEVENINFVCLDTNVNDLNRISKSKAKIRTVQTSNTQTVGSYLDYDEDALVNWFPKNAVLYEKTVTEGAGQVRAISRLSLNATIKTGKIRPLFDAVDDLFRKTGNAMKQAIRCVIVSTASGGTGSGMLLPLAMYIRDYVRNKYPNTSVIVRSLILLPETLDSVIHSSSERNSQKRNAYATIKEINAFMMKGSGFFDVNEDLKRYSDLHIDFTQPGTNELKSLSLLPFDFCFLLDGQDAEDSTMVSLAQYKKQAAQSLYEQNIGPMSTSTHSMEDNIIKEMSNLGNFGRNRFGGIGAGVLSYPYEDIADYIAYDWAVNSIGGGEGQSAKWMRYDKACDIKYREAVKKGLSETEIPKRAEVYIHEMKSSVDPFSKDLCNKFLGRNAEVRVTKYFNALAEQMHQCLNMDSQIRSARDISNHLEVEIDYEKDASTRGKAKENLGLLRDYEAIVKKNAQRIAENTAEALLLNENKTINEEHPYSLEFLLKNSFGDVCHPNAARYMLYLAKMEMDKRVASVEAEINNVILNNLLLYSENPPDTGMFDVKFTKKKVERNLDELCEAEKSPDQNPSFIEKLGGYDKIFGILNECFPAYFRNITLLAEKTAELAAYRLGAKYLKELNEMYEGFYRTFKDKVSALLRKQDEIVDKLKFNKGDSILYICSDKGLLKELSRTTQKMSDEGSMLDNDLNAEIFDAVKANVRFEREIQNLDVVDEDRRIDIFDKVLLGYFKKDVRRTCDNIDLNIIEAIAMENRLRARIRLREQEMQQGSSPDAKLIENVTHDDNVRYIQEIIAKGARLSAPGIQRIVYEEPREIKLCAYNKTLDEMRNYRVGDLLSGVNVSAVVGDTVSRYEMHFFNALYNLTPDKLKKFASGRVTETGKKEEGLYQKAYLDYSKNIGPDSTKNMMISTHIDKRWDSLAVMPEIDFEYQKRRMMKIHQAMIYGLVHGAIRRYDMSLAAPGKKVYKYENSSQRKVELVVSNGSYCDEFYEILDALYISSAIVEDMSNIKAIKRKKDKDRNSDYRKTAFARDVEEFFIEPIHTGKTSLFEIPLAYYNSLPNSQRFIAEISSIVDAVIKTFQDEMNIWEKGDDARFILCEVLAEQFKLFIENYKNCPELKNNIVAKDNPVVNIVFRKIRNVFLESPEPDDFEKTISQFREMIS